MKQILDTGGMKIFLLTVGLAGVYFMTNIDQAHLSPTMQDRVMLVVGSIVTAIGALVGKPLLEAGAKALDIITGGKAASVEDVKSPPQDE